MTSNTRSSRTRSSGSQGWTRYYEAALAGRWEELEGTDCMLRSLEIIDIEREGTVAFQLHLWNYGTACLFEAGTAKRLGAASQHGFRLDEPDEELSTALARAFRLADPPPGQSIYSFE